MSHFEYPVVVDWQGGRDGNGTVRAVHSNIESAISIPPEYHGPGNGTNPEELLTSAAASCYGMTLGIMLKNRNFPIKTLQIEGIGSVEKNESGYSFTKLILHPRIVLDPSSGEEVLQNVLQVALQADTYCIVGNAIRGTVLISIEPEVTFAE